MKIELKLNEMFAISRIVDKQPILGYRAALTKLLHKMLDIEEFSKVIEMYEEIKINEMNIVQEFNSQRKELSEEIQKNGSNKVPPELQVKLNQLNIEITQRIQETNNDLLKQVNNLLEDKSLTFDFEFDNLLIKSINNIVESEKTAEECGIDAPIVKFLIDVYIKFQEK